MTMTLAGVTMAAATLLALIYSSGSSQAYTRGFVDDQGTNFASRGYSELGISDMWGGYQSQFKQDPQLDFINYLNSRYTWTRIETGVDALADSMRQPGDTIEFAAVNTFDAVKLGKRVPTKFNYYRRMHDEVFPNTTLVKQKNMDILVAAESQLDLGYATPHSQATSFANSGNDGAQRKKDVGHANWVGQYLTFSNPPTYKGLDFGLLTKNLQCTLCHLHVNSVEKAFNKDPGKYNSFPKVKVGSTHMMGVSSGADTVVEGTILQRGNLEDDGSGSLIASSTAAARLKAVSLNPDGTIKQDSNGNPTLIVTTNTPSTSGGQPITPAAGGSLYTHYASDDDKQTEGVLPNDDFPSPFPDIPRSTDNNRPNHKIDADEVALARSEATAASDLNAPGTLKGGVALTLPAGTSYTDTSLPNSGQAANITTGYDGNVILTGSSDNPIKLDGKVVIDGDVIIRGYVQGTGQILATGNIYILGDVIYKDKFTPVTLPNGSTVVQENFGQDANSKPNLLGLVAGKNIIVGDYLSQVTNWNEGGGTPNPDFFKPRHLDESGNVVVDSGKPEPGKILTFEESKYLNPAQNTVMPGAYVDPATLKAYSTFSQPNFTMFQLGLFNQLEYTKTLQRLPDYGLGNPYDPKNPGAYRVNNNASNNPTDSYDPDYVPRFYSFYKYDTTTPKNTPVYVTTTGAGQSPYAGGNGGAWNSSEKRWNLARHSADPVAFTDLADIPESVQSPASLAKKNVINIHPDWISPDTMMKIISSEEQARQSGTRRIDGLLYTNNAMLAIERTLVQTYDPATNTWSNTSSKGGGNLQINGAVCAPDMGVIVPNGQFNLNYDQRVASLLKLNATGGSSGSFANSAPKWSMVRKGFTKFAGSMPTQAGADDDDGNHGSSNNVP